MTKEDVKKAEKIATESAQLAKRALAKSDQLQAYLSLLEHKAGKTRTYTSARSLFKKLKLA